MTSSTSILRAVSLVWAGHAGRCNGSPSAERPVEVEASLAGEQGLGWGVGGCGEPGQALYHQNRLLENLIRNTSYIHVVSRVTSYPF